jgi:hypothetical protein
MYGWAFLMATISEEFREKPLRKTAGIFRRNLYFPPRFEDNKQLVKQRLGGRKHPANDPVSAWENNIRKDSHKGHEGHKGSVKRSILSPLCSL